MGLIKIAATGAAFKNLFSAIGKDAITGAKATKNAVTPQFMRKAKILLQKNKQLRNQMAGQAKSHAEEMANASKTALEGQKNHASEIANASKTALEAQRNHASEMANASKTALEGQKNQALHDKKKLRKTIIGLAAGSLGADAVMNAAWYRKTKNLKKEQNV